jgi:predicted nucleic acid-binding protein
LIIDGKLIDVSVEITDCRDFTDNFLLSLAVESKSDYLVTGDSDLLIIKKIKKTKILNWTDFINEIK